MCESHGYPFRSRRTHLKVGRTVTVGYWMVKGSRCVRGPRQTDAPMQPRPKTPVRCSHGPSGTHDGSRTGSLKRIGQTVTRPGDVVLAQVVLAVGFEASIPVGSADVIPDQIPAGHCSEQRFEIPAQPLQLLGVRRRSIG